MSVNNALHAMTNVINNFMSNVDQTTTKRKRVIERPYGESLTSIDALLRVNEKESKKKKRATSKRTGARRLVHPI